VTELIRVRIMNVNLDLKVGKWRYLSAKEFKDLKELLSDSSKI
jgi:23S rRNA pseudouridine2604 synthase